MCVIPYPKITKPESPLYHGKYQDQTREYGVFKLLLTGLDDSALTEDMAAEIEVPPVSKLAVRPEVLEQMIYGYEDELAALTDNPEGLDAEETAIDEDLEALQASFELMERKITETSQQRKQVYDRHNQLGVRRNEPTNYRSASSCWKRSIRTTSSGWSPSKNRASFSCCAS